MITKTIKDTFHKLKNRTGAIGSSPTWKIIFSLQIGCKQDFTPARVACIAQSFGSIQDQTSLVFHRMPIPWCTFPFSGNIFVPNLSAWALGCLDIRTGFLIFTQLRLYFLVGKLLTYITNSSDLSKQKVDYIVFCRVGEVGICWVSFFQILKKYTLKQVLILCI